MKSIFFSKYPFSSLWRKFQLIWRCVLFPHLIFDTMEITTSISKLVLLDKIICNVCKRLSIESQTMVWYFTDYFVCSFIIEKLISPDKFLLYNPSFGTLWIFWWYWKRLWHFENLIFCCKITRYNFQSKMQIMAPVVVYSWINIFLH